MLSGGRGVNLYAILTLFQSVALFRNCKEVDKKIGFISPQVNSSQTLT